MKKIIQFFRNPLFLIVGLLLSHLSQAQTVNIYAAPDGNATASGLDVNVPVSLGRAIAVVKANTQNPCIVWLKSGVYSRMSLTAGDTRPSNAPVTYQSMEPDGAVFQPEINLNTNAFTPIPANIQARIIDPTAKTKVMQMSLAALDLADTAQWPASFSEANMKTPRFYKNGLPLPMSRYPADTTIIMRKIVNKGSYNAVPGGSFKYQDDRGKYWLKAIDDGGLYLSGNWQAPWIMDVIRTTSLDVTDSLIVQAIGILGGLGTVSSRILSGHEPYYALNLVEEIAAEGQWSINFKTKMLYMWVPSTGTITCAGNAKTPAISLNGVSNTRLIGMTIRGGSGNGIELVNCSHVLVAGTHISYCSGNGVTITGGTNCTIQSNDIDSVGAGGVIITSASFSTDQFNLVASGHQVINNHIYSYAREAYLYSGGVNVMNAIGTYIAYNKIHDCPHVGILYGGNNNVLEYNEVYDVVKKYTDMGAFYKSEQGDIWHSRGNHLHHNYIHDAPLANGLYQDDYTSGDSSSYNIVENVVLSIFDHYGYFNAYSNNIVINGTYPVTTMVEADTSQSYAGHLTSLKTIWNGSAVYKKAYPECTDLVGPSGRNNAYTSRIWPSVTGCVFIGTPGIFSNVNNDKLFNADGTTNASYAQTGPAFTTWNTVFQNNMRLSGKLLSPDIPFTFDNLKSTGAFGLTYGPNWHINRIGLHTDSFRTDISSTRIPGIDPILTLRDSGNSNFTNPGTYVITACIKGPNAGNILTSMKFMENGAEVKGLTVTPRLITFDSAIYTVSWVNPYPGKHQLTMVGNDSTYWKYTSDAIDFMVKGPLVPILSVVNDPQYLCSVDVQWVNLYESNMVNYRISSSTDSVHFKFLFSVNAKCNDSSSCSYSYPITQNSNEATFYQIETLSKDGSSVLTNIAGSKIDCSIAQVPQASLFPNPANTMINLNYASTKGQSDASLMVYDILGQVLLQKAVSVSEGPNKISVPLTNMSNGVYLLVMEIQHIRVTSQRFIIQR